MVSVESSCDVTSIAREGGRTKRRPLAPIVEQYHESIQSAKGTVRLLHSYSTREEKIHAREVQNVEKIHSKPTQNGVVQSWTIFSRRKERWEKDTLRRFSY